MVAMAIGDLVTGTPDTEPGVLVGLLIFFSGTALASAYLAKTQLTDDGATEKLEAHNHETIILKLAMQHNGRLNIAQIAALSPLSVNDAQVAIKTLTTQGVAELEFTADGEVFYLFAGLGNLSQTSSGESEEQAGFDQKAQRRTPAPQRDL